MSPRIGWSRVLGAVILALILGVYFLTYWNLQNNIEEAEQMIAEQTAYIAELAEIIESEPDLDVPPPPEGIEGAPGAPGPSGMSAYEVALANGFEGSETEWLESLEGDDGAPGPLPTAFQVAAAVSNYCLVDDRCRGEDGLAPTPEEIGLAVSDYCSLRDQCAGDTGAQGEPGRAPTAEEIADAVAAFCAERNDCVGATGPPGESITGPAGPTGPPPTAEEIAAAVDAWFQTHVLTCERADRQTFTCQAEG
jgi:hypothetical protein